MSYELTVEPLGETIEVEEGQTVLDAALRAGVWLPHACCHGLCGTCKVQVVEGEYEHGDASPFALMDFEREENITLACCATAESDLVIEADVEEEPDAERHAVRDYTGTVTAIEDITPTAKAVFIELDGEGIDFQAGMYINLRLPEVAQARAFSLSNPPSGKKLIELNIRKVPGGEATTYIHEKLKVGDKLELSGPYGRFFVRRSAPENLLFLAGGTGLSSPRCMIKDLLERGETRPITLVYGARNRGELYYHEEFVALAEQHENFTYVPALSEPEGSDAWEGATGFVHDVAKQHFNGDFQGWKAYLCGPPPMIDACITTLIRGRLYERDMYMEKFITAADAAQNARKSPFFKSI
ncbi:NADH:ubiquinone reductase (Na(+)-transporting) subunit F [Alkalilimnicola sp. S0819]|uniref:NADH:ubiquinone reductase (Na(+)-transporting) subunit F n=1 Tax=Alkalilimnicola sp. S0819 TaxID=2613922 RepID=UPI001261AC7A|nr:phenol 2-monooxygenase domain-containing protein [Alkalilimnicola sp. S0819]KAB7627386.1 2Fe-2S iron-sulfur cluster binding domain-containing protein [Alkalilimnicola sp. S0819]MPQ16105.1 2Fe-2S iron-sulfur cluster binding domain-containing protein [Alkalilimnicola sp. S0819]